MRLLLALVAVLAPAAELQALEGSNYYNRGGELTQPNVSRWLSFRREGDAYMSIKRYGHAIAYYTRALESGARGSAAAGIYLSRANAHLGAGDKAQARADYQRVIGFSPKDADDYVRRGRALERIGNYTSALSDYRTSAQRDSENSSALNSIAWLRATCPDAGMRDAGEGIRTATKACELTRWKDSGIVDTLAAAYAEAGEFGKAVTFQEEAVKRIPRDSRDDFEERLSLYRQKKPYRDLRMGAAR